MHESVFLQSRARILGSGTDSVLFMDPSATSRLIVDGDHWHQEITPADPGGFRVGDGVRLVAEDSYGKGTNIVQRALIASSGIRFKLDRRLEERFHLAGAPDRHEFRAAPMHQRLPCHHRERRCRRQQGPQQVPAVAKCDSPIWPPEKGGILCAC
jgi:hypothetical protein